VQQRDESAEAVASQLLEALPTILRPAPSPPPSEALEIVDREGLRRASIN
jgi:hypothetical protein